MAAAVLTGTLLTVITEALSAVQRLSSLPLTLTWGLLTVIAGFLAFQVRRFCPRPGIDFKTWPLSEKVLLGFIVFIAAVTAVTACVGTPNTWDAMTYHLPRVEHWIQNKTVAFYPTHILRQLYYNPGAEFAVVHLWLLGAGENSANFVQWSAMLGSVVAVSLIAEELGAGRRGQLLAAAMAACLPMGILQSVSTQTDYAGGFWLLVFAYLLMEIDRTPSLFHYVLAGLSLGLALLTKGTGCVFAVPFLAWLSVISFRQRISRGLACLLLVVVCAAGVNLGQCWRNVQAFGSPAGGDVSLTNEAFDWKILWVNLLRNASSQFATPFVNVNESIEQAAGKAARCLGADINDPRATFGPAFSLTTLNFDEDYAGNFLHSFLLMIIFVLVWFYRPRGKIGFYTTAILAAFLLFCLIVRFQPWNVRFHLPLFLLGCPLAGTVLEHFLKQKSLGVAVLLFLGALPWLLLNHHHPWFGHRSIWKQNKFAQYFANHADLARPYAMTAAYIKSTGCRRVGLLLGADSWEYPLWRFLGQGIRIEHVGVENPSRALKYPQGDFDACIIIAEGAHPPVIMEGSSLYGLAGRAPGGDEISIYKKMEKII